MVDRGVGQAMFYTGIAVGIVVLELLQAVGTLAGIHSSWTFFLVLGIAVFGFIRAMTEE